MTAVRLAAAAAGLGCLLGAGAPSAAVAAPVAPPVSVRVADAVLARWPDPLALSRKGWEYTPGIVLRGVAEVYRVHGQARHLAWVKRWVDAHLGPDGRVDFGEDEGGHNLDRIQPAWLLLFLHEETGDPRYRRAAMAIRARFDSFPTNRAGGFWHKKRYPNQMWLDGLYMAQPFLVRYGRLFGEPSYCFDTAVRQILLAADGTRAGGGLFRHAWDAERAARWADPATGVSPEVWGRSTGWFLMALVDVLGDLPAAHPGRPALEELLREAARGAVATQDAASGLWYQVMDKGSRPGNWTETSASGMVVYALRTGVKAGILGPDASRAAERGWKGLLAQLRDDGAGRPVVTGAVEGMSVQADFDGYVGKARLDDSPHGLCAFLLASTATEGSVPSLRHGEIR